MAVLPLLPLRISEISRAGRRSRSGEDTFFLWFSLSAPRLRVLQHDGILYTANSSCTVSVLASVAMQNSVETRMAIKAFS